MKLSALALPRRVSLAVVARDASNPSTGLFAKQQVAGRLGLEPRSSLLENEMLPLHHQPMQSRRSTTFMEYFTTAIARHSVVVGYSGIEPETSDLSGLRANRLCQCPFFRLII